MGWSRFLAGLACLGVLLSALPSTTKAAPGFTRFLDSDFKPEYFAENHVEAHAMLLAMKKSCDN